MKSVALYCRVSTSDQNCQLQRDELTRYAQARGWAIHAIYEDQMTGRNVNRPQFQQALMDARSRQIDVFLVWKLDRAFRSMKDMVVTLGELGELGVEFVSFKDNLDLTTSTGKLMTHILGAFAEFEASMIKERVVSGLAAAKRRGVQLGRPKTVDAEKILRLRQQGQSMRQIAKALGVGLGSVSAAIQASHGK